jgi:hypothetical protein
MTTVSVTARARESRLHRAPERILVLATSLPSHALRAEDFRGAAIFESLCASYSPAAHRPAARFPHPRVTAALAQAGVGVEVMDLQAACRTYNILVAEERKVAAALLFR